MDVLLRQADVDEVACDGDVVGSLRPEVGDDAVEHGHPVDLAAMAQPVGVPEQPLQVPIARGEPGNGPQMHIGQVRDGDGRWHWRR